MHIITPFSHNGYMKSLEFYKNYITLLCLEQNYAWHISISLRDGQGILESLFKQFEGLGLSESNFAYIILGQFDFILL
jgi:hypothetical protein